ncbi:sperm-associated antigen 8 [Hemicordylus capensis]|uniref:sperm-associated antigen 8 n=1 Tax=Hemicordylus capensis TaxID=884348 RepID=UPI0023031DFC|nr:sperm-associated antigen 8 [Hemicordylus capensis]
MEANGGSAPLECLSSHAVPSPAEVAPGEAPGEAGVPCPGQEVAGPEAAVPVVLKTPAYLVQLPACHGTPGPTLGEIPATGQEVVPIQAPGPPRELPIRGKCLMDNWQEERATNALDRVPNPACGTEGYFYRHGHCGLLTLQSQDGLSERTTMKDSYQRPWRTGLPVRGKREAMMEWLLRQKYSKELLEDTEAPPPQPMESLSTTHRDFQQEGFVSVPPAPSKPHDYRLEQPQSFWLEHARRVPGVSSIRTGDTPFKKCATFTTPITEYLDQPLPYGPENYPKL